MSSFDKFYKEWKEKNNITQDIPYQKTNSNEIASSVNSYVDNVIMPRIKTTTLSSKKTESKTYGHKENMIEQISSLSPEKQKELEEKLAQFKNQSQSVNLNQKEITNRTVDNKIESPKVQIANKQYEEQKQNKQTESIDKLLSDYKAKKKAEEINKNIQKGGADAVNATIENTLNNFSEGVLGAIAGIANVPIMLGAGVADGIEKIIPNVNSDIKNNLLNEANRIGNKFTKYTNANPYIENDVIKTTGSISNTIGNMVPSIVSNIFLPGSGAVAQGLSVGGKTAQDSVNNEKDNIGQSILKGAGYGTASGLIEKLTGGNVLGKGSLDDFATNFIGNKISSKLGQKIASKGYEFLGEELEEFLENQVDHAIDLAVEGKGVTKEEWLNEFNETNKNTFLTTAVLNLLGLGGNTYQEIQNNPNIDTNTKQAVSDIAKAIKENNLGGKEQLEQFINNKLENSNSSLQQQSTQNQNILQSQPTTIQNEQINSSMQQTIQPQNKTTQNGNMEQIRQRLQELKSIDTSEMGLLEKSKIKSEIRALEEGYTSVDEWRKANEIKKQEAIREYNQQKEQKELKKENFSSFNLADNHKQQQLDIINKNNPADDDMHTWIRNTNDIKDFEEAFFEDGEYSGLDPDFTEEMANKAKKTGKITVYSSYPIEQGVFVSPSVMEASQYAGGDANKLYSKEVNINDVAWIDGAEGQYAKVNNLANKQETLYNDIALGETKNVPIEELLSLQTNGGYRNQEQIKNLREDISKNGIQTPIELVRNNDGSITIENGNHRLQIAKELGIKEVPVKFVDSWDNIGIDSNIVKKWEDIYNGNNQNRAGINKSNEGTEFFEGSVANNRNQLENGATATTNDRLFDKVQAYNDRTSSSSTFEKNNQELEKSGSINLPENSESQNKTAQDEYDMPYRDDVKIKKPKQSSFYKNAMSSKVLNPEAKREISKNKNARFYEGITNKETFANASEILNSLGDNALSEFNSIENKNATAEDVALGLQLMKKYQDKGDYVTEAQIAGKLREIGTESGQTVQAFSILQRMSPEGVLIYTQRQIENAKKEILKNKSQSWIDKNQEVLDNLNLTQEEAKKIVENMKEVNNTDNQRQKEILLGEVQKIITDKIPATLGDSFKAYRRISMLFNPKTIVRNITGNVGVAPINMIGDSTIGTLADKLISKKTGMRTTGTTNLKTYGKGFKEGAVQAFDDFRRGINTRDINGDKFEIGSKGKSFNDNKRLGKALNKIDALTNFSLDVGDRPFFKAEFMNELENLMKLNNVSEPTVDMIETATKVAEQRTWQDSNKYSDTVLNIRKGLNGINIGGVGFGDIVIPFAKTPANLTKAIVDYSPLGVVNAIVDANKLNKATSKGQNTAIMQKKLVDDISKAFMGSMLYIIGTGLAKAGITSGEADDDKDIANFEKNVLGIQPYSIKIGDKSFTYDWAQPLAAPLGITANLTKKNKSESAAQSIFNAISQGGNMLYEQSFLQNLKKLLDGDDIVKGSIEAIADIPSSLVPTFIKQIAEVVDPTARTTYEYNNIPKTALNKVVAKLPFASKTLQPATDTMGRSIMKNGAEEGKIPNIFNIFLNPATTAKRKENPSAEEIYRLYKETGDKTVFPRVAPYYETLNKEKVVLTPKQKTKIQQISGTKANSLIAETIKSNAYKKLSDEEKVKIINDLVDYSFGKATNEVIKKDLSPENKSIQKYIDNGLTSSNAVIFKNTINNIEGKKGIDGKNIEGSSSGQKALAIMKMNVSDDQKNKMLSLITTSKNPETVNTLSRLEKSEQAYTDYFALNKSDTFFQTKISRDDMQDIQDLGINQDEFMKFAENIGNIKSEKDKNGKTISGSKKKAVANYINSLNLSSGEKAILFAKAGYPDNSYKQAIYNYINGLNLSATRKKEIWDSLGYK